MLTINSNIDSCLKLKSRIFRIVNDSISCKRSTSDNSDIGSIHHMMNRLWYGSNNDMRKKIVALEKGEQELEYVFYLSNETDKLEKVRKEEFIDSLKKFYTLKNRLIFQ